MKYRQLNIQRTKNNNSSNNNDDGDSDDVVNVTHKKTAHLTTVYFLCILTTFWQLNISKNNGKKTVQKKIVLQKFQIQDVNTSIYVT